MASGKLEVQIGADNSEFKKKIQEVEMDVKDLSKIKLERIKLGLDTKEITGQINDAKKTLNDLKTSVKDAGNSFNAAAPKIANGGNALMQFSRIAQDAPFGIMGIGNNITATAESFGYLKQQTGSTSGALKAMASSLMGTGGILLGVSLLTTGLTLMAQSGLTVGDVIDKITGKFDGFGAALKKANEEAAKSAAEETASIKGLISVAQDETLSRKNRIAAINELQSKYPAYFGNLSKEQIMTQDLTGTVNDLSKALINKAIAQKMSEAAVEPTLKLWQANAKLLDLKKKLSEQEKENTKNLTAYQERGESQAAFIRTMQLKSALIETRNEIKSLTLEVNKYQASINKASQSSSSLLIKAPPKTSTKTPKKTFNTPQVSPLVSEILPTGLVIPPINTDAIKTSIGEIRIAVSSELLAMQELMYNFSEDMSALVENSIGSTFSNLGASIGEALASGQNVFSAIGQSLLQSLSSFLSDMGDLLIKYGTLAVAKGKIDLAIAAGGPVSIGAGLAAIAVGVLLKAASGALGARAKGGAGQTSTATGSGANNNTSTSGGGYGWSGGGTNTVVFEIAGTSLIGVLNNTTSRNLRIGGR